MKRLFTAALAAAMMYSAAAAIAEEKYTAAPEIYRITIRSEERVNGVPKGDPPRRESTYRTYVRKEYLVTANPDIDRAVAKMVDLLDEQLSPALREANEVSAQYAGRLDIETVYTVSGHTVSVLVLARETFRRQQLRSPFLSGVYDLDTGKEIALTDMFPAGSPAWEGLAHGVREQLGAMFPEEPRNPGTVDRLAGEAASGTANFTLSGAELTLHYPAEEIFPGKANILHVRFYYPQFAGMWTEAGKKAADNSRWKLIAMTFDDGPGYTGIRGYGSGWVLPQFRAAGWRVTYFILGRNILSNPDVLMAQADNNHSMQNHSMYHPHGKEMISKSVVDRQVNMVDDHMQKAIGVRTALFRAPFGEINPWCKRGINMPVIQWSVSAKYGSAPAKSIVRTLSEKGTLHDGAILMFHDTRVGMAEAVPQIAALLRDNGYLAVTVDELAAAYGIALEPGKVYYRLTPEGETGKRAGPESSGESDDDAA